MKNLILVRHAKSSWEHNVSDDKRPLEDRGITDSQLVSNEFKYHSFHPDIIFSSHANRALTTCKIFMKNLNLSDNILKTS